MNSILLPINKKFTDLIFAGKKLYVYRRIVPNRKVDKVYVYETHGSGMIVGEFDVKEIIYWDNVRTMWKETKIFGGMPYKFFKRYFNGAVDGYTYVIENPVRYEEPKTLSDMGLKAHPQNFVWIQKDDDTIIR